MAKWMAYAGLLCLVLTAIPRQGMSLEEESDPAKEKMHAESNDEMVFLEVIVNGHSLGKIGEFTLRHGLLYARPQELHDLGFRIPGASKLEAGGLIGLSTIPGFNWTFDVKNQQLHVIALDSSLLPTLLLPNLGAGPWDKRDIESGTGLTLNYDAVGTFASGQSGGSGSFDLRSFAPWGTISTDWLAYAGASSITSNTTSTIRLDSAYSLSDINTLRRYSAGDFIALGLNWNRPVHMGGLQVRSDFSMRPDLVTFPLPSLAGSAAVPSTVDVFVNGSNVASHQVDSGPFEINQLPVISGAGTLTMTMTDAQGQQVSVSRPFYGGAALLAPGLHTFAVQTGLARRNWGTVSNDYGKLAGTAFYRRGLTNRLTVEAGGEGTSGAYNAGGGVAAIVGNFAMLNVDAALGRGSGRFGELVSVGAQHIGTKFSFGGSAGFATRDYRDVASRNGSGNQRKQISAFTGLFLRHFGSIGAAYAGTDDDPSTEAAAAGATQAEHTHIVTANYSIQFHHVSFYSTVLKGLDANGTTSVQAGFTIPLGRRSSASMGGSSNGSGQLQIQQSAVRIGDWGYQGYVSAGNGNHEFGEAQYKSPVGLFTAGADSIDGKTTFRAESQGAISVVDRGIFPSNTVFDSFAVVDTGPLKNVRVFQENRSVGRTNGSGRLLVPDMRAFDVNQISIEPADVPADATLNAAKRVVRPQDRSGVVVRFPIQFSHGGLLKLVDQAGTSIPLGSTATLKSSGTTVSVGYDGEAYLEKLELRNEVDVDQPDGKHCVAMFSYKPIPGDIPSIGPITCREQTP